MARTLTVLQHGPLRFFARHPALVDFAAALSRGLTAPDQPPIPWAMGERPITIHVGIRDLFGTMPAMNTYRLGIQTEQMFDANGKVLWGYESRLRLAKYLLCYNAILDLSEANAPYYDFLPVALRAKIHFGPWVFPRSRAVFTPGPSDAPAFFGTLNERRRAVLDALDDRCEILPHHTFGEALEEKLKDHSAVLNVHYSDGVYCECPRVLLAYINGKVLISDDLGPTFIQDRHYIGLNSPPSPQDSGKIFENMSNEIVPRFQFCQFLRKIGVVSDEARLQ